MAAEGPPPARIAAAFRGLPGDRQPPRRGDDGRRRGLRLRARLAAEAPGDAAARDVLPDAHDPDRVPGRRSGRGRGARDEADGGQRRGRLEPDRVPQHLPRRRLRRDPRVRVEDADDVRGAGGSRKARPAADAAPARRRAPARAPLRPDVRSDPPARALRRSRPVPDPRLRRRRAQAQARDDSGRRGREGQGRIREGDPGRAVGGDAPAPPGVARDHQRAPRRGERQRRERDPPRRRRRVHGPHAQRVQDAGGHRRARGGDAGRPAGPPEPARRGHDDEQGARRRDAHRRPRVRRDRDPQGSRREPRRGREGREGPPVRQARRRREEGGRGEGGRERRQPTATEDPET